MNSELADIDPVQLHHNASLLCLPETANHELAQQPAHLALAALLLVSHSQAALQT